MARDANGIIQESDIWARTGDVTTPGSVSLTPAEGWPIQYSQAGGPKPQRGIFHYLYRQIMTNLADLNKMGILDWDTSITYEENAVVKGSDGKIYQAVQQNSGNDPTTDSGTNWIDSIALLNQVQEWSRQQYNPLVELTISGGNIAWDLDTSPNAYVVLDQDATLSTPTNIKAGGYYGLLVIQDGTGGHTLSYTTSSYKPIKDGGDLPEPATGSNERTLTNWFGDFGGTSLRGA